MINTIELKGEKHPVRFSFNALVKLEEILGENPFTILADEKKISSPVILRAIVYCGLWGGYRENGNKEKFPFKDVEQVGDLLEMGDLSKYIKMFVSDISRTKKKETAKR